LPWKGVDVLRMYEYASYLQKIQGVVIKNIANNDKVEY